MTPFPAPTPPVGSFTRLHTERLPLPLQQNVAVLPGDLASAAHHSFFGVGPVEHVIEDRQGERVGSLCCLQNLGQKKNNTKLGRVRAEAGLRLGASPSPNRFTRMSFPSSVAEPMAPSLSSAQYTLSAMASTATPPGQPRLEFTTALLSEPSIPARSIFTMLPISVQNIRLLGGRGGTAMVSGFRGPGRLQSRRTDSPFLW